MQQIIIEVFVPAISAIYDFRLPSTALVGDVIQEMIRTLEDTQQNQFFDKTAPVLCDRRRGVLLNPTDTVAEAGLQDGAQLLLV